MKTANPNIQIFTTYESAERYFNKLHQPAMFLQGRGICTDYFVEKLVSGVMSAKDNWPNKYDVIEIKG